MKGKKNCPKMASQFYISSLSFGNQNVVSCVYAVCILDAHIKIKSKSKRYKKKQWKNIKKGKYQEMRERNGNVLMHNAKTITQTKEEVAVQ